MHQLRSYQQKLVGDVYSTWQGGARNVLAVLPTGGGKTLCVSHIALERHNAGVTQCVMAHRSELVEQMSLSIASAGIPHRIVAPSNIIAQIRASHRNEFKKSYVDQASRCSVIAVQTLIARKDELASWAQGVDFWTLDEAHHALVKNQWGTAIAMFPRAYGLGVTGTPQRLDGHGLGRHADGVFDAMVFGPDTRELIDQSALCEFDILVPPSDFNITPEAITPSGEFGRKQMRMAAQRSHIVGDIVREYLRHAAGKRGITFATDTETAIEIAQQFNDAGVPAVALSAKSDPTWRRESVLRFRAGNLLQLVNVDLFDEGFDVPAVQVVSLGRPTMSLGKYRQMIGRALRPKSDGSRALIIDHVSNVLTHGLPDRPHRWSLDRREKRGKSEPDPMLIDLRICTACTRPFERIFRACPYCGEPVPLPSGRRTIEQVDGDLLLLDAEALAKLRASTVLESPASICQRVMMAAGENAAAGAINRQIERNKSQQRLSDTIAQWAAVRRAAGDTDSIIHRRFYLTFGIDVLSALAQVGKDMDAMSETISKWWAAT